ADVLGLAGLENPEESLEQLARSIRAELNLGCVVIHPRRSAAAATETETARFDGPFVNKPKISTGAGDHFHAGFSLGRVLRFNLRESLCLGVATSGYYVRTAKSPTAAELVEFTCTLPPPQESLESQG